MCASCSRLPFSESVECASQGAKHLSTSSPSSPAQFYWHHTSPPFSARLTGFSISADRRKHHHHFGTLSPPTEVHPVHIMLAPRFTAPCKPHAVGTSLLSLQTCPSWTCHTGGVICYMGPRDWLLSLSILFSPSVTHRGRSMCQCFILCHVPSCGQTTLRLSVHPWMGVWGVSTF